MSVVLRKQTWQHKMQQLASKGESAIAHSLQLFVSVSQALDAPLLQTCEMCECTSHKGQVHKGHVWHD